jgi:hypothetical protein
VISLEADEDHYKCDLEYHLVKHQQEIINVNNNTGISFTTVQIFCMNMTFYRTETDDMM